MNNTKVVFFFFGRQNLHENFEDAANKRETERKVKEKRKRLDSIFWCSCHFRNDPEWPEHLYRQRVIWTLMTLGGQRSVCCVLGISLSSLSTHDVMYFVQSLLAFWVKRLTNSRYSWRCGFEFPTYKRGKVWIKDHHDIQDFKLKKAEHVDSIDPKQSD